MYKCSENWCSSTSSLLIFSYPSYDACIFGAAYVWVFKWIKKRKKIAPAVYTRSDWIYTMSSLFSQLQQNGRSSSVTRIYSFHSIISVNDFLYEKIAKNIKCKTTKTPLIFNAHNTEYCLHDLLLHCIHFIHSRACWILMTPKNPKMTHKIRPKCD